MTARVGLLFGGHAEIVADVPPAERAERECYSAAQIAAAISVRGHDLPGVRLAADTGEDGRLCGWRFA
jgi:hypothetical protein